MFMSSFSLSLGTQIFELFELAASIARKNSRQFVGGPKGGKSYERCNKDIAADFPTDFDCKSETDPREADQRRGLPLSPVFNSEGQARESRCEEKEMGRNSSALGIDENRKSASRSRDSGTGLRRSASENKWRHDKKHSSPCIGDAACDYCIDPPPTSLGGESLASITMKEGPSAPFGRLPILGYPGGGLPLGDDNDVMAHEASAPGSARTPLADHKNAISGTPVFWEELVREDRVYLLYATAALKLGDIKKAKEAILLAYQVLKLAHTFGAVNWDGWIQYEYTSALWLAYAGDLPAAEGILRELLVKSPFHEKSLALRARIQLCRGAIEDAHATCMSGLVIAPEDPTHWMTYAQCQQKLGNSHAAGSFARSCQLAGLTPVVSFSLLPLYVV
eukprot:Selendium_serpulae@DN4851_c0_g1_i1.p1